MCWQGSEYHSYSLLKVSMHCYLLLQSWGSCASFSIQEGSFLSRSRARSWCWSQGDCCPKQSNTLNMTIAYNIIITQQFAKILMNILTQRTIVLNFELFFSVKWMLILFYFCLSRVFFWLGLSKWNVLGSN